MEVIHVRNVNYAYPAGMNYLLKSGVLRESRNGTVLEAPTPVTTWYEHPRERVLFDPVRDCNPFFHLMESLWILDGRNDVAWISYYNSNIANYSDNGQTFYGAYGWRLRNGFNRDQLWLAARELRTNPDSRRVVLGLWDPTEDLGQPTKDLPCNVALKAAVGVDGRLNLMVFNRSNDIIWGAYGANAVQFSFIQEYLAAMARRPVGWLQQISTNYHAYTTILDKYKDRLSEPLAAYPSTIKLVDDPESFDEELSEFMSDTHEGAYSNTFLASVAVPMRKAWVAWKAGAKHDAVRRVNDIAATDWRWACLDWMTRRLNKNA